jgi:predicted O-methyltransferase YrrM
MEDLPQILLEIFDTNRVFARNGTAHPLQSNVSLPEALELYTAVRNLRPEFSVEIGLAHGVSALAILAAIAANGTGHHYLIDPFQSNYGYCGETMIERGGYHDLHTFLERFPEEALPALPAIKFAFVDSSHLFDLTLLEFVLIDKKLEIGGVVALHDTCMPSIQAVMRFVLANRPYEVCRDFSPREADCRYISDGNTSPLDTSKRFQTQGGFLILIYCFPGRHFGLAIWCFCENFPMINGTGVGINAFRVMAERLPGCRNDKSCFVTPDASISEPRSER